MKVPTLVSGALISLLMACTQEKGHKVAEVREIKKHAQNAHAGENAFVQAATLEVTAPAGIYFHPDSAKLQKLEASLGEKFFTDAEKSMGDLSTSRDYLVRNKIKIIETEATHLTFTKADGSTSKINLSSPEYTWGLILFNGEDDPLVADMANPQKQVSAYMTK